MVAVAKGQVLQNPQASCWWSYLHLWCCPSRPHHSVDVLARTSHSKVFLTALSSAGMQDEGPFPHHKRRGREELLILVVGSLQLCLATCQGQHVTCFAMLATACQIPEGQTSVGPIQHERLSKTLHNAQIRTALHSISQLAACFLHIR